MSVCARISTVIVKKSMACAMLSLGYERLMFPSMNQTLLLRRFHANSEVKNPTNVAIFHFRQS